MRRLLNALPVLGALGLTAAADAKPLIPRFVPVQSGPAASTPAPDVNTTLGLTLNPQSDPLAGKTLDQVIEQACRQDPQGLRIPSLGTLINPSVVDVSNAMTALDTETARFLRENTLQIRVPDPDGGFDTGSGWRCTNPANPSQDYIITNAHVVGSAIKDSQPIFVADYRGTQVPAQLIGISKADGEDDVAVLAVLPRDMATLAARSIPLAKPGEVPIGLPVRTGGYPFGIGFTHTGGFISNTNVSVPGSYSEMIQSDAAVNPGNSGGPMVGRFVDARGNIVIKLVGMNTEIFSPTGSFDGITLAKPSRVIASDITLIRNGVNPRRGLMGIDTSNGSQITGDITDSKISINQNIDQDNAALTEINQAITAFNAGQPMPDDVNDFLNSYGIDPTDPGEKDEVTAFLQMAQQYFQNDLNQMRALLDQVTQAETYFQQNPPDPNAVYILTVVPNSYAAQAGLRMGDKLVSIDGTHVDNIDDEDLVLSTKDYEYQFRKTGTTLRIERQGILYETTLPSTNLTRVGNAGQSNRGSGLFLDFLLPGR